jgi:hemoglobin
MFQTCCKRRAPSLYSRLGGKPCLSKLTSLFYESLLCSAEGGRLFSGVDMAFHQKIFTEFLCSLTGGTEKYSGRNMKEAHCGLALKEQHWQLVIETLGESMKKIGVEEKEIQEVLELLGPFKKDIIVA